MLYGLLSPKDLNAGIHELNRREGEEICMDGGEGYCGLT